MKATAYDKRKMIGEEVLYIFRDCSLLDGMKMITERKSFAAM